MRASLLLIALALGIFSSAAAADLPAGIHYFPPLVATLWLPLRQRAWISSFLLMTLCFSLGLSLCQLQRSPPLGPTHLTHWCDGKEHVVESRLIEVTARPLGGYSLDLESIRLDPLSENRLISGRIRLFIDQGNSSFFPGDILRFQTKLLRPRLFGTPGEFDYPRKLAESGIFITGFVRQADDVLRISSSQAATDSLAIARRKTGRRIDTVVEPRLAPLVRALTIGDMGGVSPQITDLLSRGGISHLFAISGLNLAMLATALYALGLSLYRRSESMLLFMPPARSLPPVMLVFLSLYLLWTGSGHSSVRAFLMLLGFTLLAMCRRKTSPLNLLWFAAFIILLLDPLALFAPSFQLSLAAVAGLLLAFPQYQPYLTKLPPLWKWIVSLLLTTGIATLATLPLILYHFHQISPAALLTNLAAIPLVGWLAVPTAIGGCCLSPLWPEGGRLLYQGCATILDWTLTLTQAALGIPGLQGWVWYPSIAFTASLAFACGACLIPVSRPALRMIPLSLAAAALVFAPSAKHPLSVTALSVGQGEALLLTIHQRHYLIDGGGLLSERFDTGSRLVGPALGRLGVNRLEAVILTHSHPDHAKGLAAILSGISCNAFYYGGALPTEPDLRSILTMRNIPAHQLPFGWTVLSDSPQLPLAIFRPPSAQNANDESLVVYAGAGAEGVLLCGDLETSGVRTLINSPPPGPVTLLKLPHHGSHGSSPELLIEKFEPQQAFTSAGFDNSFNFPHPATMAVLTRSRIPFYHTDIDGSFRFELCQRGWRFNKL